MADDDMFTFVNSDSEPVKFFDEYQNLTSAKLADLDIQITSHLRSQNPELIVTTVPTFNVNLLSFAEAGHASAELDIKNESIARWRGFIPPLTSGGTGQLAETIFFAKYHYSWDNEEYILYTVGSGFRQIQYILKEPRQGETQLSHSSVTDSLIRTVGAWQHREGIWVYDGYWRLDPQLYQQVKNASWDDVILDPKMKKDLTEISEKFFDSKDVYDDLGVPWKRGLIFYGPAGNGKTISIKALMHTMFKHNPPIATLYVKSTPHMPPTFDIRNIFLQARQLAPCMLVLEDIDTIVTPASRSYFFNEVDGLEKNDGVLMVASTNHLDRLDPGLAKRPSRFDRKYLFPLPSKAERIEYCKFWRRRLSQKPSIIFPAKLCPAIAGITDGFSFAYIQEAFVAALLELAHDHTDCATREPHSASSDDEDSENGSSDDDDLDQYELWRAIKHQVKILRGDMDKRSSLSRTPTPPRSSHMHLPGAYPEATKAKAHQQPYHMPTSSPSFYGPPSAPNSGDLAAAGFPPSIDLGNIRLPYMGWIPTRTATPQGHTGQFAPNRDVGTGHVPGVLGSQLDPSMQGPYGSSPKRSFTIDSANDWRRTGY